MDLASLLLLRSDEIAGFVCDGSGGLDKLPGEAEREGVHCDFGDTFEK